MPINPTQVLRHIERKLGASHYQLELSREDIIQTVIDETLPTFSNYFPYEHSLLIDPAQDRVEGHIGVQYLKTDFDIVGISKVLINNVEAGLPNISSFYSNPFDMAMQNTLESMVVNPTTYRWVSPDKIEIFPKNTLIRELLVVLKVVHPKHMKTIPMNLRDEFYKLALYDVCESLYPIRQRFSNIQTTFGSIELFMQQLEEASSKREELLEKWRSNFLKSPNRKKIFVY